MGPVEHGCRRPWRENTRPSRFIRIRGTVRAFFFWLRFASEKGSPKLETEGAPLTFTAVYMAVPEGYIGFVEEIPGANSQGETLDEVRENLREAVQLVLEANRELAEQGLVGKDVEREPFELAS